jgi:hypothetical protein
MTHGTRSGYNGGCRCPSCTEANTEASRARRNRLASHAPSGPPSPRRQPGDEAAQLAASEISEATSSRSVRAGSGDLFEMLSGLAEGLLTAWSSAPASRVVPQLEAPARSTLNRLTAAQFLPPSPPQVSRVIPHGRPAFRLLVACGCPFGWDTPDMPDVVVCPKHGNTRVASGWSSETWSGEPLPLPVPAEPELREVRPPSQM